MVRPLSSITRARARSIAEGTMTDTCEVLGDTTVADGEGGTTPTPIVLATTVCGVSAVAGGPEQVTAARLGWSVSYVIRVPVATVVTPANRLRTSGRTFEIGAILDRGAQAAAKRAVCRELNG